MKYLLVLFLSLILAAVSYASPIYKPAIKQHYYTPDYLLPWTVWHPGHIKETFTYDLNIYLTRILAYRMIELELADEDSYYDQYETLIKNPGAYFKFTSSYTFEQTYDRFIELCRRANKYKHHPSLVELRRFPDNPWAWDMFNFSCRYDSFLQDKITWALNDREKLVYENIRKENERHRELYRHLLIATDKQTSKINKIEELQTMLDMLGPELFYNSQLPPPVPLQYFSQD